MGYNFAKVKKLVNLFVQYGANVNKEDGNISEVDVNVNKEDGNIPDKKKQTPIEFLNFESEYLISLLFDHGAYITVDGEQIIKNDERVTQNDEGVFLIDDLSLSNFISNNISSSSQ